MSYLVLARKYRPQTFEDVVGQIPVSQTLLNAVETGRVAHAYIFSGPRGVGKTTTARILAKCLNCVKGPTKTPCNTCDACLSISQSNSTDDVLEIDGASNRGIEQIRELRDNAKYAPAKSRYRIFIIDEAHQITKDAFGALLKTLEEPPDHVVFMMATTEVQKIPSPILSRCQRFSLRPIPANLVFEHLKLICEKEKIKVDDDALANIVRFVEGSLRDALSLLDQALVFAPKGITSSTIRELLGLLPTDLIRRFAGILQKGDPTEILLSINENLKEGIDLTQLARDLQNYYHTLLLSKAGVEDVFKLETESHKKEAAAYDFSLLERNIRLLSKAVDEMRRSDTPRALFEIYALRLGQKTLDPQLLVERLEKLGSSLPKNLPPQNATPSAPAVFSSQKRDVIEKWPVTPTPVLKKTELKSEPPTTPQETPESPTATNRTLSEEIIKASWPDFINDISAVKATLAGALEDVALHFHNNQLTLIFSKTFPYDLVAKSLDILKPAFVRRFGALPQMDLKLDRTLAPAPSSTPTLSAPNTKPLPPSPSETDAFEEVSSTELSLDVQKALKHFPGTAKRGKTK